ncbi:MAG TPA: ATP-binding protein [Bdellovibrionota bacterium]|nr:ATP-binding protein [Bdellovibrionota bacterium]
MNVKQRKLLLFSCDSDCSERYSALIKENRDPELPQSRFFCTSSLEKAMGFLSEGQEGPLTLGWFDFGTGNSAETVQLLTKLHEKNTKIRWTVVARDEESLTKELERLFGASSRARWDFFAAPVTRAEFLLKAKQMFREAEERLELQRLHFDEIRKERLAAISQLARGMGHELGNALLKIIGRADLALLEQEVPKIREHLESLMSAAERAGLLVKNLQSFSKGGADFEPCAVLDLLDEALCCVLPDPTARSIHVSRGFGELPLINVDRRAMIQAFANVILNAIQAMPNGGHLKVMGEVSQVGGRKLLLARIIDSGQGISPEILPRIFDFAFSTRASGGGLGLSIAKQIIMSHGGEIDVQSQVGAGTEVIVSLPLA